MNYFIIVIIVIVIDIFLAWFMYEVAIDKGYTNITPFILCLVFPLFGWIYIAALPDKIMHNHLEMLVQNLAPGKLSKSTVEENLNLDADSTEGSVNVKLEQKKEQKNLRVSLDENDMIVCPSCKTKQKGNRTVCYECGVRFIMED